MSRADTPERLLEATITLLQTKGIAGLSARSIAAVAEANQALVFYHFGSVAALVVEASRVSTARTVEAYRPALTQARSLRELLAVGRRLHARESEVGNVRVMAQLLAAAQGDPQYAAAASGALRLWTDAVGEVLVRLLARSPILHLVDVDALARAVSAAFVGLELYQGVDPTGAEAALDALDRLGVLVDVMDSLGPVERGLLQRRLQAAARAPRPAGP